MDNEESHAHFVNKQLPFLLLIDKQGEVSKLYGTLCKLDSIEFWHGFIINLQGSVIKIYRPIISAQHSIQVLRNRKELQS